MTSSGKLTPTQRTVVGAVLVGRKHQRPVAETES